jgi:Ca2+-binding RTX toxin-like protein
VIQGGWGNDLLSDLHGTGALLGGDGKDTITGGTGNDFIAGGAGDDVISTGATHNVVAFNGGDGKDTFLASPGASNTLSLGGGIEARNLKFSKSGNDLVLKTGWGDSMKFKDWYASVANQSCVTLQLIEGASESYNPRSTNPLINQKVETFDFGKLVAQFNQALAANQKASSWSLMNGLLSDHLGGSNTTAIGGDLAYQFGQNGSLCGMDLAAMQAALQDHQFGKGAQAHHTSTVDRHYH